MEVTDILTDVQEAIQKFRDANPTGICVIR